MTDVPMSPEFRCTLLSEAIANHNKAVNADPAGVPIAVVVFGPRLATMPIPGRQSWTTAAVIGASIVSKATATEIGLGIRRQPWPMRVHPKRDT